MEARNLIAFVLLILGLAFELEIGHCGNVTYDHRALVIDGKRRILQSGSIHYPRATPEVRMCVCVVDVLFVVLSK